MILVDSNIWRQTENPGGDPTVQQWLSDNDANLALSAVVLGEMHFGMKLMPEGKRKTDIAQWLEQLSRSFEGSIVSFDRDCAVAFGELAAHEKRAGRNPSTIDLQIAAQAITHRMSIATRNVKDFAHSGVTLINPWEA